MMKYCWEIEQCGREPGGKNTAKAGVCPVAIDALARDRYLEIAEVMIAVINTEGTVVYMNRKGCKILGYERDELINSRFDLLIPEDIRGKMHTVFQKIIHGEMKPPEYHENELVGKDGDIHLISFHNSIIRNIDGSIAGILFSGEDITDRRISENKLAESEKQLNIVVESAIDAIVMIDSMGNIALWNKAAEKMFGYSAKEIIGKSILDVMIPAKYRQNVAKGLSEFGKTGRGKFIGEITEAAAMRKNGSLFPVELSISAINLENKWHAIAIIRDITERKTFEKVIRNSERKFRLVSEKSSAAVYIVQNNLFKYVNPAFESMFGYDASEVIDKLSPFDLVIYKDHALLKKNMLDLLSGKVSQTQYDIRGLRKDGTVINLKVFTTITQRKGRSEIISTIIDVTEQKNKELRLQQEKDNVKKIASQFKQLTYIDGLTGIYNRRMLDETLSSEWKRAKRNRTPLSFVMIDIDLFKGYNDGYGHLAGDRCLVKIAKAIKDSLFRPSDCAARYGGEEFGVILPDTKLNGALMIANRIRINVQNLRIPYNCSPILKWVTISLGVAHVVPDNDLHPNDLIRAADLALYKAKNSGRNKVAVFEENIS
ncbi:MAG: PAS domain S-box protein [Epsilonproteobacteria bacterium]|nr:PAS domain S-box protein [Campylobacterota bacterium]